MEDMQTLLPSSILRRASNAVGITQDPPSPSWCPQMSRTDRMKAFVVLILVALLFFTLAFFVGLPLVILAPSKFALSFSCGSLTFMAAFAFLEGPWTHFQRMMTWQRAPFSLTYLASLGLTL